MTKTKTRSTLRAKYIAHHLKRAGYLADVIHHTITTDAPEGAIRSARRLAAANLVRCRRAAQ